MRKSWFGYIALHRDVGQPPNSWSGRGAAPNAQADLAESYRGRELAATGQRGAGHSASVDCLSLAPHNRQAARAVTLLSQLKRLVKNQRGALFDVCT